MKLINADTYSKVIHDYFSDLIEQGNDEIDILECNAELHKLMQEHVVDKQELTPKKTNADRIRAMSDEELAKHFAGLIRDTYEHEYCNSENDWLIWLQSEVEEEHE